MRWSTVSPTTRPTRRSSAVGSSNFARSTRTDRMTGAIDKEGFDTGRTAVNPFTGQPVPVWIANFVLAEYGTGAVMAVPAHDQRDFEFARKYGLPVDVVIQPETDGGRAPLHGSTMEAAYAGPGRLVSSGEFTGRSTDGAAAFMATAAAARGVGQPKVQYRLKDWGVSRQRYWGTPIPIIHCDTCGLQPVPCEGPAGRATQGHRVHRSGRFAPRADSGVRQYPLSRVSGTRPARDRHDGHLRRLLLVFLPVLRRLQRRAGLRPREGSVLGPGRLLYRWCRTRDTASDLLPLLLPGLQGSRHGRPRRTVYPVADPGHGAARWRRHVEVQRQRRRPRPDGRALRRRHPAAV